MTPSSTATIIEVALNGAWDRGKQLDSGMRFIEV
jgi:hypothetical protein